VNVKLVTHFTV